MNRTQELYRFIFFIVILGVFFSIASILKSGEVVVGNDSTLLYQIDPIAFAKNLALTPINSTVHPQYTAANYFLLPLTLYSSFQIFIATSFSLSPSGVRLGLNISLSIVSAYLLYSLILKSVGIDKKAATFPAILGAFAYASIPILLIYSLSPLYYNDSFFVYPFTLFLVIRYIQAENPLLWLGIAIIFINMFLYVFSISTAPFLISFISIALFAVIYFGRVEPYTCALRISIMLLVILFSSAYYWIPQALVFNDLFGAALTEAGNLARLENKTLVSYNTLTSGFSGISSGSRILTLKLRGTELDSWDVVLRLLFVVILMLSIVFLIINRNDTDQSGSSKNRIFYLFSLFALGLYLIYLGLWAPSAQLLSYLYTSITNFPGGSMFRDPNKWGLSFVISYGMIVSITAVNVFRLRKNLVCRIFSILFIISLLGIFCKSVTPLFDRNFQSAGFGSKVSSIVDGKKFLTEIKEFHTIAKQGSGLLWVPLSDSSFGVTPSGRDGSFYVGDGAAGILSGITTYYGYANLWRGHDKITTPLESMNTLVLMQELQKYNIKYIAFPKLEGYLRQAEFPYQTHAQTNSQIEKWKLFVGRCGASRIMSTDQVDVYDLEKCSGLVADDYIKRCFVIGDKHSVFFSLFLRGSIECSITRDDLENMIVLPFRYSSGWIFLSIENETNLINFLYLLYSNWKNPVNVSIFNSDSYLSLGCQKGLSCINELKSLDFYPFNFQKVLLINKVHLSFIFGMFISVLTFFYFIFVGIKSFLPVISSVIRRYV